MANNRIEVYAYSYAYKITNNVPGYTLSKAKRIFRNHFYLVQKYVTTFKDYEEAKERLASLTTGAIYFAQMIKDAAFNSATEIMKLLVEDAKENKDKYTTEDKKVYISIANAYKNLNDAYKKTSVFKFGEFNKALEEFNKLVTNSEEA